MSPYFTNLPQINSDNFKYHLRQWFSNTGLTWGSLKILIPGFHPTHSELIDTGTTWTSGSLQVPGGSNVHNVGSHGKEALLLISYQDDFLIFFRHQDVPCQCILTFGGTLEKPQALRKKE